MPNNNLKDNVFITNDGNNEKYTALAMQESRLKKAKEDCQTNNKCDEFKRLGGEEELKRLETIIHTAQKKDHTVKKIGMDAGRENQFISTHEKDRDNANPTQVGGVPKVNKGSINKKIMTNTEVYNESIKKEINEIRYLIEYMNNNSKKQKL